MGKDIISYFFDCGQCPMESVSWNDIQEFIKILSLKTGRNIRLPTEAEWEYAAKGGKMSANYLYPGSNDVKEVAWTLEDSRIARPSIVGQKKPNELSLYDMGGNVNEWCLDWYGPYTDSVQVNPQGPKFGNRRVTRGGGWNNGPSIAASTTRRSDTPDSSDFSTGFRLVWSL
jgi:formylglycine-generating enzyme required for sulfatase activity